MRRICSATTRKQLKETFKATFKGKVFNSELHTGPDLVLLVSSKIPESQNHIRC